MELITERIDVQAGVVDLAEAMGARVHGGRLQGSPIVFHTRPVGRIQPSPGGRVNAYNMTFAQGYPMFVAVFVRVAVVLLALFALVCEVQGASSVGDGFDGGALDWCKWEDVSAKGVVAQEAGELRLATVGTDSQFESAKVLTQYQVTGDFDVQVDYRRGTGFAEALPAGPSQFPQINVALGLYWDEARFIQFSRAKTLVSEALSVYASLPELAGKPMPYALSNASAGTLRMVRTGGRVTFLHSTGSGWTELGAIDTPATPAHLYLITATAGVQRAVTAQMDNFRLNSGATDDIEYEQPTFFHKRNDFAVGGVFETYPARRFWGNAYATVDPFKLFRENGMTWARVGVTTVSAPELASTPAERWNMLGWHNHFWGSREYATASLKAAAAQGMRLDVFLYFSHEAAYWGNQKAPPEWAGKSVAETAALMEQYAYETAQYFKQQGLNVEIYEMGGETDIGMVDFLPGRRIAVPPGVNFVADYTWLRNNVWNIEATLLKAGIAGIRRANPSAKVSLHIALEVGTGPEFAPQFFRAMRDFGVDYDYAALSHPYAYYPWKLNRYSTVCWFKRVARTVSQIASLGAPVMIVEASYPTDPVGTVAEPMRDFPFTPAGQADWVREQLRFASALPGMAGWFYWNAEFFGGWMSPTDPTYALGFASLLAADGVAWPALAELRVNLGSPPTPNDSIVLALEEPAPGSAYSGVSNVRGWAVAPQGVQKIELYVDSAFQGNIPLGGRRSDVGTAYPGYPGSGDSGFAMAFNYSNLAAGSHTLTVRAFDTNGGARDASATFTVARFATSFMADPAAVNVDQATLTRGGNTLTIQNLLAEGQPYNVQLNWRPAAQGFAITQINPTSSNPTALNTGLREWSDSNPLIPARGASAGSGHGVTPLSARPAAGESIVLTLEEPANDSVYSGISNVRGWAVAPQGLTKIELYVDGALQGNIPLGGRRSDVGTAYPNYPGSSDSGFAMAYNYSNLAAGSHTLAVRAYDNAGGARDASAAFTVARFATSFMSDPAAVNLDQATITRRGNTLTVQNLQAASQSYNAQLTWRPAAQGFAITQIDAN